MEGAPASGAIAFSIEQVGSSVSVTWHVEGRARASRCSARSKLPQPSAVETRQSVHVSAVAGCECPSRHRRPDAADHIGAACVLPSVCQAAG